MAAAVTVGSRPRRAMPNRADDAREGQPPHPTPGALVGGLGRGKAQGLALWPGDQPNAAMLLLARPGGRTSAQDLLAFRSVAAGCRVGRDSREGDSPGVRHCDEDGVADHALAGAAGLLTRVLA